MTIIVQLTEATASLASKTEVAVALEAEVGALKLSLDSLQADVDVKEAAVQKLEAAKTSAESQLSELKQQLETLQSERASGDTVLEDVRNEVRAGTFPIH